VVKTIIPGKGVSLECVLGDIADQPDIDIIVNAANAQLSTGGGVAGAIHSRAGQGLAMECRPMAPIKPGEAVITGAHKLPNKYVIHCLGPIYGVNHLKDKLLESCYRSALNLAESSTATSIAFPALSTGIFGYPVEDAFSIALKVILDFNAYQNLRLVRIVLWSASDYDLATEIIISKLNKV
jgi:O-acetyl-ADP-ribose deacetylase (regulator of RNase III)